jgi:methyltransferase (TIGR00027 family)
MPNEYGTGWSRECGDEMNGKSEATPAMKVRTGPGTMAEGIAVQRFAESILPEDVRIFSDPYAIHFIDPVVLAWTRDHPVETKAIGDEIERKMPGWSNAIRGRIRYFDDIVQDAPREGFSQMVLLGAGYDTRAYRIGGLDGHMKFFEVDRPEIVTRKIGILKTVVPHLTDHVTFIPLDMAQGDCWQALAQAGWLGKAKTLFLLEGLLMYLPEDAVRRLLAGIAEHAGPGSAVLFDFLPRSLADGSSDDEGGQNIRDWTIRLGEPILSGFAEGEVVPFLTGLGFSRVNVISSRAFASMYYTGKNAGRKVSGLMSITYATLAGGSLR